MRQRRWLVPLLSLSLFVGVGRAHELGGSRFDAPVPLAFLFVGAGVTVAVTALWLGVHGETKPDRSTNVISTIPSKPASALRGTARALFFGLFALAVWTGITGVQVQAENVATVFVWPVWLKGVGLFAILFGSPWSVLSPWRTLYDLLSTLEGRPIALLGDYPQRVGTWPAVVGFVGGVGIIENLTVVPRSPLLTATLLVGYALVMLLGAVSFGPAWFRHADFFAVLYDLFGRVAPFRSTRTSDGATRVSVRRPWRDCLEPVADSGAVVFVVATVYTVSFDGFTSTPEFQQLLFRTRDALGLGPVAGVALYVLGLAAFVGVFLAVARLIDRIGVRSASGRSVAPFAFAPTLLPISVAYELAHTYPYVVRNVGQLAAVSVDAVAATTTRAVDPLGWLSLPAFWGSQVVLIVLGHVVAVVAAHRVAAGRYDALDTARRAHAPLVLLMVGYTILSLWIISRPVVSG